MDNCFAQNAVIWAAGRCYAQPELAKALVEAADELVRREPGAGLAYLDASGRRGGKLLGHLSHLHGNDVDILYLWRDRDGRRYPRVSSLFQVGYRLKCDTDGRCGALVFDRPANLALVRSLLHQKAAKVEKIFVEPFIRTWLLEEAGRQKLESSEIARLGRVLRYAGANAAPHTDHLHVRFAMPRL